MSTLVMDPTPRLQSITPEAELTLVNAEHTVIGTGERSQ
jgi:hypothetical protein